MNQIAISFSAGPSTQKQSKGLRPYQTPPELLALFPQSPRLVELMMFRYRFGLKQPCRTEQAIIEYYTEERGRGEEIAVLESAIVNYFDSYF